MSHGGLACACALCSGSMFVNLFTVVSWTFTRAYERPLYCCVVDGFRLFSTSKVLSQDKSGREQDGKEENENEEQPEG